MKKLDRQNIVNEVYRHFIANGQPAGVNRMGMPGYHNERDGRDCPCAIGLFDTDRLLSLDKAQGMNAYESIEDLTANAPNLVCRILGLESYSDFDVGFLKYVQHGHDRAATSPDFRASMIAELSGIAYTYGLDNPHAST